VKSFTKLAPGGAVRRTKSNREAFPESGARKAALGEPRTKGEIGQPEIRGVRFRFDFGLAGRDPAKRRRFIQQV